MISHVAGRFAPQVAALALNVAGDPALWRGVPELSDSTPILADTLPGGLGPLAGILTALIWAETQGARYVVTLPADIPFAPCDLVPQLMLAAENAANGAAIARSAGRDHPVSGFWPVGLRAGLHDAVQGGLRKVSDWDGAAGAARAVFETPSPAPDAFTNINTPADLATAEQWLMQAR